MNPEISATPREALERASELAGRMRTEIRKVFVGQDDVVDQTLVALFAAGHLLIEGVPGLGKTLLVRALARSFAGSSTRIQFTPDLMPADVVGHVMYEASTGEMRLRRGPVFTNLLLADEINRAPAKTQAALLEVMQERQVTLEGQSLAVPAPFMTLATQNPIELEGTYPLPEAQIDRFLLKVQIDYPSAAEELELVRRVSRGTVGDSLDLSPVTAIADAAGVVAIQSAAASVFVDERISEYVVRLVRATRTWAGVALGAGPRGGLALVRASRALALLDGRGFVTPDDIKAIATPALRHRILLSPEVELEGQRTDLILDAILAKVEAPRT
ncbi:MAG: MoxR family ATPase [Myxococcota bacterium]